MKLKNILQENENEARISDMKKWFNECISNYFNGDKMYFGVPDSQPTEKELEKYELK